MNRFDIYYFEFAFEDTNDIKVRPVLILDDEGTFAEIVKITKHPPRNKYDYKIINWEEANLKYPSTIRFNKVATIYKNKINRFLGRLSDEDIENIKNLGLVSNDINEAYLDDNEEFWDYKTGEVKDKDIFDTTKTGMSYYDDFISDLHYMQKNKNLTAAIVKMSPKEYFREVAKIFNSTPEKQIKYTEVDKETIQHLFDVINKYHRKFPITFINYAENSQEGRHRMYVAAQLTSWDTKFPVMVIDIYDKELERKNQIISALNTSYNQTFRRHNDSFDDFKFYFIRELSNRIPNFDESKLDIEIDDDSICFTYDDISPEYCYVNEFDK